MPDWLILTGGAATRLGQDKANTRLGGGRTLLERVSTAIEATDAQARIYVVGPERSGGPAAAVAASLPECSADLVGVVAVDMPFIRSALLAIVAAANDPRCADHDVWLPVDASGRQQWLCALYRRSALTRQAAGEEWANRPFHKLVSGLATCEVTVHESTSLIDIDTPADLRRAENIDQAGGEELGDG